MGTKFSEIRIKLKYLLIHENALENVVWEMAHILSTGGELKYTHGSLFALWWLIARVRSDCSMSLHHSEPISQRQSQTLWYTSKT